MQIAIRFALFELVRELLEIRPAERRSSNFDSVSAGFSVLEQRVPMNPSFLTACVAACLRDRSRPRIALAKCSRNDFDGQATKAAHAVSTAPPSLLWHVRGDPHEICHGVSSSKQRDDCAQARIARNFGQWCCGANLMT